MSDPGGDSVHVNVPLGASAKKPKKNKLSNMIIKEVSFCPAGMNQGANIALYKSVGANTDMNLEDLKKQLEASQAENEALKKADAAKAAELATVNKDFADLKAAEAKKKPKPGEKDPEADDMAKAETLAKTVESLQKSNAELLKESELQKAQLAGEIAKRENMELAKRAETELPNLAGTPEEKGKLLKAAEALGEVAVGILKSADTAMAKNFEELGTTTVVKAGSAQEQLNTLAKTYSETKGVTIEKAMADVLFTPAGEKLYKETQKK